MTLAELKALLSTEPPENDHLSIKVWLPGKRISFAHKGTLFRQGNGGHYDTLLIEGKLDGG